MRASSDPESVRQHSRGFAIDTILAGVVLLALAPPAEAKIVYTPVNVTIVDSSYNIDLNNDGVTDFSVTDVITYNGPIGGCVVGGSVSEMPSSENGTLVGPLTEGDEIGPDQDFDGGFLYLETAYLKRGEPPCIGPFHYSGPWDVTLKGKRYLGLSFQVSGQTYYGWAQLTVLDGGAEGAKLYGYAYETIPDRPIEAGQTTDADGSSALRPGPANRDDSGPGAAATRPAQALSLGTLTLGTQAVPLLQRKESAGAAPENS